MKALDFLSDPSHRRLRKEIQNICDSYSHPWDILAELCQNSVDAILLHRRRFGESAEKDHRIEIELNAKERSIRVYDTGVGFAVDRFAELLAPHGTDKDGTGTVIGEKGVGLTYTIFTSDRYHLKTKSTKVYIEGLIEDAARWKNGHIDDIPLFKVVRWVDEDCAPAETFTEIVAEQIERTYVEEEDLFHQTLNVMEHILRTRTAIGYLKETFGDSGLDIAVKLRLLDATGQPSEIDLSPRYMLPDELVGAKNVVDTEDFKKRAATLDDRQKARELQGKALRNVGSQRRAGRKINYYVFFAPSRNLWKEISDKNQLVRIGDGGDRDYLYRGGIYIGSRGMPTGIRLEPPISGKAGYWPNFYMILEDDSITFDLGRKSVPSRTKGLLRDLARSLFEDFIPYVKYVTTDPPARAAAFATVQQYEKSRAFEQLKQLPDIGIDAIGYLKHPDGQEAAVVAVFHELIGAGILKGYESLRTGYKQTYDLWSIYRVESGLVGAKYRDLAGEAGYIEAPSIIEFKFTADDILDDFEDNLKYFIDVDLIVCWDLDETEFGKHGVKVELIGKEEVFFYGSNYLLVWPGAYNLGTASEKPVLALRRFLQDHVASS